MQVGTSGENVAQRPEQSAVTRLHATARDQVINRALEHLEHNLAGLLREPNQGEHGGVIKLRKDARLVLQLSQQLRAL